MGTIARLREEARDFERNGGEPLRCEKDPTKFTGVILDGDTGGEGGGKEGEW